MARLERQLQLQTFATSAKSQQPTGCRLQSSNKEAIDLGKRNSTVLDAGIGSLTALDAGTVQRLALKGKHGWHRPWGCS